MMVSDSPTSLEWLVAVGIPTTISVVWTNFPPLVIVSVQLTLDNIQKNSNPSLYIPVHHPSASMSTSLMRIAACSYEGSLFGWKVTVDDTTTSSEETDEEGQGGFVSTMDFGFNCSAGALKCVAISTHGKYLCCGGTDERIRIFNMAENRSMGELGMHEGAITSLAFFDDSHLISGSEDSSLRIWRCHDWECLHVLHGHKAAIVSVAIHPTGKIALSVSKDNTMKLWNLIQGRCSFTRRLKGPADKVHWHSTGLYYMLVVVSEVQVYRAADNECVATIKHKTRVNQAIFCLCGPPIVTDEDEARVRSDSNGTSKSNSKSQDTIHEQGKGVVMGLAEGTDEEVDRSMLNVRVASVCEDKTLFFHNIQGVETARLDMQELHGRPRDMWACPLALLLPSTVGQDSRQKSSSSSSSSSSVAIAAAAASLEGEGDGLVVASSQSRLVALSCRAIEEGHTLDECSLVSMQTKAEPRLTCVVAWSTSVSSNHSDSIIKAGKTDKREQEGTKGKNERKASDGGCAKSVGKSDNSSTTKDKNKSNKASTSDSGSSNSSKNNSSNKRNNKTINNNNTGKSSGKDQDKNSKKSGEKRTRDDSNDNMGEGEKNKKSKMQKQQQQQKHGKR